ncbi:MAG: hypothetical protein CMJ69_16930 [Planctomycetaceae bacterium]|nr:hypothetical protein [Planctomycetaceae bacterium]|tara:strand:+ start:1564 stop:2445 length:882 start_codon:yes stop_codon:yes gene_type:complete
MKCHDALLQLDAARPDGSDWGDSGFDAAREHLENCLGCRQEVLQRRDWDLAFLSTAADSSCDTSIPPEGLTDRILSAIDSHTPLQPDTVKSDRAPSKQTSTRHRLLNAAAVVVAVLIGIGVAWRLNTESPGLLTVEQIRNWPDTQFETVYDDEALAALPEWLESQGGAPLPPSWDPSWLHRPARGWPDRDSVAVMSFRVPVARRGSVAGLLVAVPIEEVKKSPAAEDVTGARPTYSKSGRFSTTAWTDTNSRTVFVCLVAPGQHERLRRALPRDRPEMRLSDVSDLPPHRVSH